MSKPLSEEEINHKLGELNDWMFENDRSVIDNWLLDNPQIDTIWHVARACRTDGPRRDMKLSCLNKMQCKIYIFLL